MCVSVGRGESLCAFPSVFVQGSVRGKADMYHQALGGGGSEKTAKPAPVSGKLLSRG